MRSAASQWNDLMKRRKVNMRTNGMSNSSRKIVKANKDSVTKNHKRSYRRFGTKIWNRNCELRGADVPQFQALWVVQRIFVAQYDRREAPVGNQSWQEPAEKFKLISVDQCLLYSPQHYDCYLKDESQLRKNCFGFSVHLRWRLKLQWLTQACTKLSYEKWEMRQQLACAGEIDRWAASSSSLRRWHGYAYVIKERRKVKRPLL